MSSDFQNTYISKEQLYGANNYSPLPVVLEKAEGAYLWDVDGNKYLDLMSAYSAVSHGHSHPELVKTLQEQAAKLAIASRALYSEPFAAFLEKLTSITGYESVLTMNTGAEAVETAIKAARRWGYFSKGIPEDKAEIIVANGNFHGRTTTIVGFSSEPSYKKGFGPFDNGFKQAEYCGHQCDCIESCNLSIESFKSQINQNTCAILVEPIQGEGGIIVPRDGWLKQIRKLCDDNNILLILDEIQSGLGRTGKLFAYEHEGIRPDGLIIGKALGGGLLPVSAFLSSKEVMDHFQPGSHGSTFGGNPLGSVAASVAIDVVQKEKLDEKAHRLGLMLINALKDANLSVIENIRGKGLLIAIDIKEDYGPARYYTEKLMHAGLLAKETKKQTIRFAPPLVIKENDMKHAIYLILKVLGEKK